MERVEHCFMVDRMLGRLVAWLRIFGYDTKSTLDLAPSPQEDTSLIEISKNEHRILLSRDRALVERAKKAGVDAVLLGSDDVRMQLDELMRCYYIDADPVMTRCTACNYTLRKAMENDLDYIKNSPVVPEGLAKDSSAFWICDRCGRVYWQGSHWRNILKTADEVKAMEKNSTVNCQNKTN